MSESVRPATPASGTTRPLTVHPVLRVEGLRKRFVRRRWGRERDELVAVDGVDFEIARPGECLALVGESGSGKSTIARCVVRLVEPDEGSIFVAGSNWLALRGEALRRARAQIQMVFQDPGSSLDPRLAIVSAVAEPITVHRGLPAKSARDEAYSLLERCGLDRRLGGRLPSQLSGGQRQRVAIARALATAPALLVADEPTAALDAAMQGQILDLLATLQAELGLALLLISHDLAAVERIADRVAVCRHGRIVENGTTAEVLGAPQHPYTVRLLAAAPRRPVGPRGQACHDRLQPLPAKETSAPAGT